MKNKIKKLLKISGAYETTGAIHEWQVNKAYEALGPLASLIGIDVKEEMKKLDIDEMLENSSVPAWIAHADEAMVDALIAFYESPEGQRLSKVIAKIQLDIVTKAEEYSSNKFLKKPPDPNMN